MVVTFMVPTEFSTALNTGISVENQGNFSLVVDSNNVLRSTPGSYTVTYTVGDGINSVEDSRTVVVEASVEASSGGDPYVYPLVGPSYKLPNCEEVYRLYQNAHVVINAQVSVASPEIQAEIVAATTAKGFDFLRPVSAEAYFYSQILVASRTTNDQVLIDLEQKHHAVTGTTNMFRVELPEVSKESRPYEDDGSSYVGIPVRWGQNMCLSISFSRNPQIRNGVRLTGISPADGTGLLVRNYRPKFFRLPHLLSTSAVSIPDKCTRPLTKRGVVGHKEFGIKC